MLADLVAETSAWISATADALRHLDHDLYFSVHGAAPPAAPVLYAAHFFSAIGGGFALFLLPPIWLAARKVSAPALRRDEPNKVADPVLRRNETNKAADPALRRDETSKSAHFHKGVESLLLQLLFAVVVTAVVVFALKFAIGRTRPCYALHAGAWCTPPTDPSFPSGHAAGSMAVAVTLARRAPTRAALLLLVAAAGVAWSRVVLGVHFPSDVLAGAVLGAGVAWTVDRRWTARAPAEGSEDRRFRE